MHLLSSTCGCQCVSANHFRCKSHPTVQPQTQHTLLDAAVQHLVVAVASRLAFSLQRESPKTPSILSDCPSRANMSWGFVAIRGSTNFAVLTKIWKNRYVCIITQKSQSAKNLYLISQHAEESSFLSSQESLLLLLFLCCICGAYNLVPCTSTLPVFIKSYITNAQRLRDKSGSCPNSRKSPGKRVSMKRC